MTIEGDATISGSGTLSLPSWGTTIDVVSGTATVTVALAGGGFTETGAGTLIVNGAATVSGTLIVDQGTLDLLSPAASAPVVVGGRAIGPGALFNSAGASLYQLDPAMFGLVQSLFVNDQAIDRADMIQILQSAVVDGGVTDDALAALETITSPQNEAALNMPAYVGVLASDVVNGNPANANYQGQAWETSPTRTAALRATALDDLVDKWFYGTDLPAIAAGCTYSVIAGPLFGSNQASHLERRRPRLPGRLLLDCGTGCDCRQRPGGHRKHDHPQWRGAGRNSCWTVRFYYNAPAICGRLRHGQRHAAAARAGATVFEAGRGRQFVDADDREGLCPVERDRPRGPRRHEQLCQPVGRLDEDVNAQVLGPRRCTMPPVARRPSRP